MSATVPGPNRSSQRRTSSTWASSAGMAASGGPSHGSSAAQRCWLLVQRPVGRARTSTPVHAHEVEHAGRHADGAGVRLALRDGDLDRQLGDDLGELRGGRLARLGDGRQGLGLHPLQPPGGVLRHAVLLEEGDELPALGGRHRVGARALQEGGVLRGAGEHRAAHREHPHEVAGPRTGRAPALPDRAAASAPSRTAPPSTGRWRAARPPSGRPRRGRRPYVALGASRCRTARRARRSATLIDLIWLVTVPAAGVRTPHGTLIGCPKATPCSRWRPG